MTLRPLNERGLTLTEVMIVSAIGLLVLMGLGGFYLNSQATWLDASAQAITQRDATLVIEAIADSARSSARAIVSNVPDADHGQLALYKYGNPAPAAPYWYFWWSPSDSLIHQGSSFATDRGAFQSSKVERFRVMVNDSALVQVTLRLRAPTGQAVEVSTSSTLRNR